MIPLPVRVGNHHDRGAAQGPSPHAGHPLPGQRMEPVMDGASSPPMWGLCGHLAWIRRPCLASHLLACLERQLPHDWQQRYRIRPVLLETFCETPRFAGTCYRAANWIHLGQTQGRGKLDTRHEYAQPVKNIFVKPR